MYVLIIIVVLVLINGFFAMSEMALVSVKPKDLHKIKEEKHKNALILEKVTKDSTKYLSTIQVAITFAGFLSSAFAGSELSVYLVDFLTEVGISISDGVAVVIITLLLSFFTLVFGELVPKRIALSGSIKFALLTAPVIYVSMKLFSPFVWLLSVTTKGILKLFGINPNIEEDDLTEKDIKELIVYGHIKGLYQSDEKDMLQRIFTFDDITVDLIMTPAKEVVSLEMSRYDKKDYKIIFESQYSRLPVFKKKEIYGIVLIKDILLQLKDTRINEVDIFSIVRSPFIVNRNKTINELLKEMKATSRHMAFIVDENQEFLGIVTLEDIVEEIIGNVYDEHDLVDVSIKKQNRFTYVIDGNMLISDLNRKLNLNLPTKYHYIENYIKKEIGEDLSINDEIPFSKGYIQILELQGESIKQFKLVLKKKKDK